MSSTRKTLTVPHPTAIKAIIVFLLLFGAGCTKAQNLIDPGGMTLESRFLLPRGYKRISVPEDSFAAYLRALPLKAHHSPVHHYDGSIKANKIHEGVMDLPIGSKDLHQCADAVMRLRAEYLWFRGRYKDIHFNFTNGFRVDYSEWMKGRRIIVEGNKVRWNRREAPSNTYSDLWSYLEQIFMYAGSASLSGELKAIPTEEMEIGDVFIMGGFPGHAVLVVDMAKDEKNNTLFMLAQSYMPAQEIHILKNPENPAISPWYSLDAEAKLVTPEWTFKANCLKRFPDTGLTE